MIKVVAVGKMSRPCFSEEIKYYQKQMQPSIEIIEIKENISMQKEGEAILKRLTSNDFTICLSIDGKEMDSPQFASWLHEKQLYETKGLTFIIGGSDGLDKAVQNRCDFHLSFSKFTFPHQLMRLFLVEQLYRAQMIIKNHPYHK